MLKRIYTKKLIICISILFAIFLIYMIPSNKEKINIKEEVEYTNKSIDTKPIYLLDKNNMLALTKVIINSKNNTDVAKELLETLIIDSNKNDNIPNGFKAILPSNTKINNITIDNDIIKVDFSKELLNTSLGNEEKIIEAITYTLTTIENIKYVIIYIDGEILTKLPKSKITLPSTLDRNFGINKEYNLINTNNINKTTIYYVSEFNNSEYYVPVTKINNDNRNKIEIIIDELSSTNIYKPNLMSYLNNQTKLISSEQNNNELILNFNDYIFNDINEKDILEEVIYTISMSIYDNYNIKNVIFNVENKEIYKSVGKVLNNF